MLIRGWFDACSSLVLNGPSQDGVCMSTPVEKSSSDNFDLIILERVWRPNLGMARSWCRQKFSIAPQHLCLFVVDTAAMRGMAAWQRRISTRSEIGEKRKVIRSDDSI
jgi:hypothetical protein